ncbi:MAG: hypothetical protein M3347_06855, partial [Armatimonadota bacterium]|nr:hypothetical protein [Armatimonadota bacterium]
EVHDNYIHDTWDGIEDRGGPAENVGLRIHHNRIFNVADDGLEPNGAEEDCHWNDNIVERCIAGFRIKAPTQGPLYAYRNIFFDNSEDYRNYGEVELKPATVFIYHNTCTARVAIQSNKVFGIGTPQYHYFNNLFWCVYWWGNSGDSVLPNWKGDYNVYVRRGEDKRWDEAKAIAMQQKLDEHSLWTAEDPGFADFEKRDVSLKENSPARGKGTDLAKLLGKPLPALEPGYFKGDAPDAGAVQFGNPMPRLPRKPEEVQVPPAGTWPGPEAEAATKAAEIVPPLEAAGFEGDLQAWGKFDPPMFQIKTGDAAEGTKYLTITAGGKGVELHRKLSGLAPGRAYALTFQTRRNTSKDARLILRDLANKKYLGIVNPASSPDWQKAKLRFVASAAEVGLEISVRSAGSFDLDDFALARAK